MEMYLAGVSVRRVEDITEALWGIREHFGQELEEGNAVAWRQANERLFRHYSELTAKFPETVEEMEPLFRAMVCACRAGRETDAFQQVYLKRIMRGDEHYAAYELGTLGPLLAVLSQFFEEGQWTKPRECNPPERQGLSAGRSTTRRKSITAAPGFVRGFTASECFPRPSVTVPIVRRIKF